MKKTLLVGALALAAATCSAQTACANLKTTMKNIGYKGSGLTLYNSPVAVDGHHIVYPSKTSGFSYRMYVNGTDNSGAGTDTPGACWVLTNVWPKAKHFSMAVVGMMIAGQWDSDDPDTLPVTEIN